MYNHFEITSLTSRWQIGRALHFAARLLCTMAKGEEYSEYTHDAEAILAHYQVDKPFKRFYQL